jgi:hypothetical protein
VAEVLADQRRLLQAERLVTRTRVFSLVCLACALLVAGCGGGSSDGKLSKSQLAAKADAICKQAVKQLDALPPLTNVNDAKQAATYFGAAKPIADKQNADLKALKPADDVKADYGAFLAQTDKATQLLSDTYAAAKSKDPARGQQLLRELSATISSSDRAAAKLGLKVCGGS